MKDKALRRIFKDDAEENSNDISLNEVTLPNDEISLMNNNNYENKVPFLQSGPSTSASSCNESLVIHKKSPPIANNQWKSKSLFTKNLYKKVFSLKLDILFFIFS